LSCRDFPVAAGTILFAGRFVPVQAENHYREYAMSSPWEPGISQAMQRHGGSNRSIPKVKPPLNERPNELPSPETQGQASIVSDLPGKPENSGSER
jgi:hypothetical protein